MMAVRSMPSPIIMIQLSTDAAPIQRVDLVEDSVDRAHITAAPRPPATAITVGADLGCHGRGKMRDAVALHRGDLPSRGSLAAATGDEDPNRVATDVHRRPLVCSFLNSVSGGERFNGRTLLGSICTCHCSQWIPAPFAGSIRAATLRAAAHLVSASGPSQLITCQEGLSVVIGEVSE